MLWGGIWHWHQKQVPKLRHPLPGIPPQPTSAQSDRLTTLGARQSWPAIRPRSSCAGGLSSLNAAGTCRAPAGRRAARPTGWIRTARDCGLARAAAKMCRSTRPAAAFNAMPRCARSSRTSPLTCARALAHDGSSFIDSRAAATIRPLATRAPDALRFRCNLQPWPRDRAVFFELAAARMSDAPGRALRAPAENFGGLCPFLPASLYGRVFAPEGHS